MRVCFQPIPVNWSLALTLLRALLILALPLLPISGAAQTVLLMAEEDGCVWCARWDAEIAAAYPKTPEGVAAPLRRYDMHEGPPEGIALEMRVRFTPTFILVRDGRELDRIEGYPGEDFFWGVLGLMLKRAGIPLEADG